LPSLSGHDGRIVTDGFVDPSVLLEVRDLRTYYPVREGLFHRVAGFVRAVDGVELEIRRGETLGLVGESGSGKTTLGKAILGLAPITSGEVRLAGRALPSRIGDRPAEIRRAIQVVFQDVSNSVNPRRTIGGTIADPMVVNGLGDRRARSERVRQLLETVELPSEFAHRYPHELSGGERQRVGIARALALDPKLIVLDEPTSSLDVSVQAKIVELLASLQRRLDLTYLLISHDLALVRTLATRIAVMYLGKIMEVAPAATLFEAPRNPYTLCLLTAIPTVEGEIVDPNRPRLRVLPGDIPSPRNPPPGCVFHTRCPARESVCVEREPALRQMTAGHLSRCHFDAFDASAVAQLAASGRHAATRGST
jgi:oligopeptide/dipeptide ABC transporter ATP-binding protein